MPPEEEPEPPERSRREWTLVPRSRAYGGESFWSTSAGVATAVASLLTAATGLIVALNQTGVIGGGDGSSAAIPVVPTMTASTVPASQMSTTDEQRLRTYVPGAIRQTCGKTAYHGDAALAAVDCEDGATDVHYELFATKADLDEHYGQRLGGDRGSGDCEKGEPGASDYVGDDSQALGNYFCYEADSRAWIEWTHVPTLVYGYAAHDGGDLAALTAWWESKAGPFVQ
jgi:hypothetical protein